VAVEAPVQSKFNDAHDKFPAKFIVAELMDVFIVVVIVDIVKAGIVLVVPVPDPRSISVCPVVPLIVGVPAVIVTIAPVPDVPKVMLRFNVNVPPSVNVKGVPVELYVVVVAPLFVTTAFAPKTRLLKVI
jgi:hypothetical protein